MSESPYVLELAEVVGPDGLLLHDMSFTIRDRAVTALLGPGGTGKSTLLRALAGARLAGDFRLAGRWTYRGGALPAPDLHPVDDIAWVRQRKAGLEPVASAAVTYPDVASAARSRARILLLDEPSAGCTEEAKADLAATIRAFADRGAVVIVTHDLRFARAVADDAILLCARRVRASGPLRQLEESPPSDLVARFLEQGSTWITPVLPPHFRWIEEGRLAGMGRPGLLAPIEDDLASIASAGVTQIVSLTEEPLPTELLRPFALSARHFPIPDMGVPSIGACARLCRDIERWLASGAGVAVHCHAGVGRTGTVLAAYLAWRGTVPDVAVEQLRAIRGSYIQSRAQLEFVRRFAEANAAP